MTVAQPTAASTADALQNDPPATAGGAATSSYVVVPADRRADADRIQRLWRRNLPEVPAGRFDWLYGSQAADAWLLQTSTGQTVGSTGVMHRRMQILDRTRQVGQAVDLNVDQEHRFAGPALKLQRAVVEKLGSGDPDLLYGFANRQSTALLRRAGYRPMGELQRWVKPLRLGPRLQSRGQGGVARTLAGRIALPLLRMASPETYRYHGRSRWVEDVERFDARFDALWATAASRFAVVGERTAAYLGWRFGQCPAGRHDMLGLTDGEDRLAAYVVYRRDNGFAYLADFFYANPADFRCLLAEFLRRMGRARVEAVVALWLGAAEVTDTLRHFGFLRRPCGLTKLLRADSARLGMDAARLFDPMQWFLTAADFDFDID